LVKKNHIVIENEIEGLTPLSQSVFGINQCIVKNITILVLSKSMELALTR